MDVATIRSGDGNVVFEIHIKNDISERPVVHFDFGVASSSPRLKVSKRSKQDERKHRALRLLRSWIDEPVTEAGNIEFAALESQIRKSRLAFEYS
jgi:hypothetical protein